MPDVHHQDFDSIFEHQTLISAEQFDALLIYSTYMPGFFCAGNPTDMKQSHWFCAQPKRWLSREETQNLPAPPAQSLIAGLCEYPNRSEVGIGKLHAGLYDWVASYLAPGQYTLYYSMTLESTHIESLLLAAQKAKRASFQLEDRFVQDVTEKDYHASINTILDHIHQGDCYQINYTQRFHAPYVGDPWYAYLALCSQLDADYCFYMRTEKKQILSLSPELFLTIENQQITTKPIKGTRARSVLKHRDEQLKVDLAESEKDRAENLMIVDLLRNDLGKVSKTGSVSVNKLFDIESFHYVHHLVSTVTGTLKDSLSPFQAFLSCFPGGSITGAPKIKAMEIIAHLENTNRGPYCGSFFYWLPNGRFTSNIAIRTFYTQDGKIYGHAGGGIVSDSDPTDEYNESLTKIDIFIRRLEDRFLRKG